MRSGLEARKGGVRATPDGIWHKFAWKREIVFLKYVVVT